MVTAIQHMAEYCWKRRKKTDNERLLIIFNDHMNYLGKDARISTCYPRKGSVSFSWNKKNGELIVGVKGKRIARLLKIEVIE